MKYIQKCDHCQHKIQAFTHALNVPLVRALRLLVDFYDGHHRSCSLQEDLPQLTKNQYNNFQKLQYFRLVAKVEGGWVPTRLAHRFIAGDADVVSPVATFNGDIIESDHPAWKTHIAGRKSFMVYAIDRFSYRPNHNSPVLTKTLQLF